MRTGKGLSGALGEGEARVVRMGEIEVGETVQCTRARRQGVIVSTSKGNDEGGVGVGDDEDEGSGGVICCCCCHSPPPCRPE
jgi:hypothetical protein